MRTLFHEFLNEIAPLCMQECIDNLLVHAEYNATLRGRQTIMIF